MTIRLMSGYRLQLYICGQSFQANDAVRMLTELCRNELAGQYELEVIDVLEHPERASAEQIVATPTLVKPLPPPLRRMIGDLSDPQRVLVGLDLASADAAPHPGFDQFDQAD